MTKNSKLLAAHSSSPAEEIKNVERLRALRLAREAASREAGTWGELSVCEVVHEPTGTTFVFEARGRDEVDLGRLALKRPVELTVEEHRTAAAWLLRHKLTGFEYRLVAWDLSPAEAQRRKTERMATLRAAGTTLINDAVETLPASAARKRSKPAPRKRARTVPELETS